MTQNSRKSLCCIVVDGHRDTAGAVVHLLVRAGHRAAAASTCAEALDNVRAEPIDLLLSDLWLPDGDGCALLVAARRLRPSLRSFAVSGYGTHADRCDADEAGFERFFFKPFDILDFLRAVDDVALGRCADRRAGNGGEADGASPGFDGINRY